MTNLVPIKVKIGIRDSGHADHPNFNTLQVIMSSGLDWAKWIDINGSGWLYDNGCGHKEEDLTYQSPIGMQWGMLLVPKQFAEEAISMFPDLITKLSETDCESFYNDRHANDFPEEEIDSEKLQAIKAKQDVGVTLTAEDQLSLDPTNDTAGIRKNKRKKWVDYKILKGYNVVQ